MNVSLIKKSLYLILFSRGKYFRKKMVPDSGGIFYLNGKKKKIIGEHYSSLLSEIVFRDVYALKSLKQAQIRTIVDVGANIGVFSLWASILFPASQLFAFEPNHTLIDVFKQNMAGIDSYELLPMALSDTDGNAFLDISGSHTEAYLTASHNSGPDQINCDVMALDTFSKRLQAPIDLLKLDCEGSEYAILFNSNLSGIRFIVGELHTTAHHTPADALKYLQQIGYLVSYTPQPNHKEGIFLARRV